jgi:hypothetical protein
MEGDRPYSLQHLCNPVCNRNAYLTAMSMNCNNSVINKSVSGEVKEIKLVLVLQS